MPTTSFSPLLKVAAPAITTDFAALFGFSPTEEQAAILDAFASDKRFAIEALAGSGKTTTLKMVAKANPGTKMTYVAFNKAIADEARRTFPRNVTASTMHSFAFRAVGKKFADRLNGPRVQAWQVVNVLRIPSRFEFGSFSLRDRQIARLVTETIKRFCHSADEVPGTRHVPRVPGMDTPEAHRQLSEFLAPFIARAWDDLQQPTGALRFDHDIYLKTWSMGDPKLPGDVILADEFQDADPVIAHIVRKQMERGAQIIPVGDNYQQIYEWRGAVNSLAAFGAEEMLALQKSFRFGPVIAERANLILEELGATLRLEGHEPVGSQLAVLDDPSAILCRTNAEAVAQLMLAQVAGIQAGLVGGTAAIESLAQAAGQLKRGEKTWHPELMAFDSWVQVRAYVEESKEEARDLAVLVKLIDTFGEAAILEAVGRAVPEERAELVISTAHKAKGREFSRVRIASDFRDPRDEETGEWDKGEGRLLYVALTRAIDFLDDSACTWVETLADAKGVETERVAAEDVPARVIEVAAVPVEDAQVICDPEADDMLVMHKTKYDPRLVDEQRGLPGRRYHGEYCGMAKVNRVKATARALDVAARFGLTVSQQARSRVEELGLA